MKLKDEYYEYILKGKEVSVAKKILFKFVYDFTDRRRLREPWRNIDEETQEEILVTWLAIIEENLNGN